MAEMVQLPDGERVMKAPVMRNGNCASISAAFTLLDVPAVHNGSQPSEATYIKVLQKAEEITVGMRAELLGPNAASYLKFIPKRPGESLVDDTKLDFDVMCILCEGEPEHFPRDRHPAGLERLPAGTTSMSLATADRTKRNKAMRDVVMAAREWRATAAGSLARVAADKKVEELMKTLQEVAGSPYTLELPKKRGGKAPPRRTRRS